MNSHILVESPLVSRRRELAKVKNADARAARKKAQQQQNDRVSLLRTFLSNPVNLPFFQGFSISVS